jgi:hypothetical protein
MGQRKEMLAVTLRMVSDLHVISPSIAVLTRKLNMRHDTPKLVSFKTSRRGVVYGDFTPQLT